METPCWPPVDLQCCVLPDDVDPALITAKAAEAAQLLWIRSGRMYGLCPQDVRPCRDRCSRRCVCPQSGCCCDSLCVVNIDPDDGRPISSVDTVTVDGVVLDPSEYVLLPDGNLALLDGCWPRCPDLTADGDDFSVEVTTGLPLDAAAMAAYGALTCELVKACIPECDCRLPANVQSVVRNGTTVSFGPWWEILREGLTGLREVDGWIRAVNPLSMTAPSRVLTPDIPGPIVLS